MTESKSLKELLQEIIEHTDAHNDRSEWRPEVAKLAQQALDAAGEFELLRSRNEYLEAQFQRAGKLQGDAGSEAVQTFVNTMIGALEFGFVDSNWLSLATVYQVMRNHCKDEFGVEVPPLVVQWGETTARECHAPPAPAAVPEVEVRTQLHKMASEYGGEPTGQGYMVTVEEFDSIIDRALELGVGQPAPAAVPEGWEVEKAENGGVTGFIVRSPSADGIQNGTAVFEDSECPAEQLLYFILQSSGAAPAPAEQEQPK